MNVADTAIANVSICSGVAMLDLGFELATGARTVVYVEREAHCAATLLARMADAALEPSPVFCGNLQDVEWHKLRGRVDSVTAGFPCQPFSQAGKREGTEDERWVWPEIAAAIRALGGGREDGPGIVYLENVSGIAIPHDEFPAGLGRVLGDLAEMGFAAAWGVLRASHVGAAHQRARVFILAVSAGRGCGMLRELLERSGLLPSANGGDVEYTGHRAGCAEQWQQPESATAGAGQSGSDVADADRGQREQSGRAFAHEWDGERRLRRASMDDATGSRCDGARQRPAADSGGGECVSGAGCAEVAHAGRDERGGGVRESQEGIGPDSIGRRGFTGGSAALADDRGERCEGQRADGPAARPVGRSSGTEMGDAASDGPSGHESGESRISTRGRRSYIPSGEVFAPGPADPRWPAILSECPGLAPAIESGVCIVVDGLAVVVDAARADQLRAIGNGVVPLQAAVAFVELGRRVLGA